MSASGELVLTPLSSLALDISGHRPLTTRTHPNDGDIHLLPPVPPVQDVTETGREDSLQEVLPKKEATTFNTFYHQHQHQHLPAEHTDLQGIFLG